MNEEAYIAGFLSKCAEAGIDLEKEANLARLLGRGVKGLQGLAQRDYKATAGGVGKAISPTFKQLGTGLRRGVDEAGLALRGETGELSRRANRRTALSKLESEDYRNKQIEANIDSMLRRKGITAPAADAGDAAQAAYAAQRQARSGVAQQRADRDIRRRLSAVQNNTGRSGKLQTAQESAAERLGRGAVIPGGIAAAGGTAYGLNRFFQGPDRSGYVESPNYKYY